MRRGPFPTAWMYGNRPLTRLEMALYACVCAVLIAIFLNLSLDYMELAEKTAMQATLAAAASGVNARVAAEMLQGPAPRPGEWAGRNPFEITGSAPASFAGELGARDLRSMERPSWVFDPTSGDLLYLPRLTRSLETSDASGALHFRLVAQPGSLGYQLVSTSRYDWSPES